MAAGGDKDFVAVLRMKHDGVHVTVEVLIQQFPTVAAIGALEHVADLQCHVHGLWIFRIDRDVADVRLDCSDGIRDCGYPWNIPDRVQTIPILRAVAANKNIDRLGTGVERVRVVRIDRQTADLAWAAFAVAGFFPTSAEIFAQPHSIAARAGKNSVG